MAFTILLRFRRVFDLRLIHVVYICNTTDTAFAKSIKMNNNGTCILTRIDLLMEV